MPNENTNRAGNSSFTLNQLSPFTTRTKYAVSMTAGKRQVLTVASQRVDSMPCNYPLLTRCQLSRITPTGSPCMKIYPSALMANESNIPFETPVLKGRATVTVISARTPRAELDHRDWRQQICSIDAKGTGNISGHQNREADEKTATRECV